MKGPRKVLDEIADIQDLVEYRGEKWQTEVRNAANARAMVAALRAVLDLHREITPRICGHCQPKETDDAIAVTYPCPTVMAVTQVLDGTH